MRSSHTCSHSSHSSVTWRAFPAGSFSPRMPEKKGGGGGKGASGEGARRLHATVPPTGRMLALAPICTQLTRACMRLHAHLVMHAQASWTCTSSWALALLRWSPSTPPSPAPPRCPSSSPSATIRCATGAPILNPRMHRLPPSGGGEEGWKVMRWWQLLNPAIHSPFAEGTFLCMSRLNACIRPCASNASSHASFHAVPLELQGRGGCAAGGRRL